MNLSPDPTGVLPPEVQDDLHRTAVRGLRLEYFSAVTMLLVEQVFGAVVQRAVDLLAADSASLMLLNRESGELEVAAVVGLREALIAASGQRVGEGLAGQVVASGKGRLLQGRVDREAFGPGRIGAVESAALAPVTLGGEVFGVLCVSNREAGRPFGGSDLDALTDLADQTALAVRNAWLYDQAMREVEELRTLQQAKQDFVFAATRQLDLCLGRIREGADRLLREYRLPDTAGRDLMDTLAAETEHVGAIAANMLDAAAVDVRPLRLRGRPVNLPALLELLAEELARRYAGHEFKLSISNDLPNRRVLGDVRSVAEVIRALVDNVIQLSSQACPVVIEGEATSASAIICIGGGQEWMGTEPLEDVFGGLFESGKALSMERVGLNLFMAKGLVEASGGRLEVSGGLGPGSAYRIILPVA
jgi:K+-sensing histidine kinase KdpD